MTQPPHWQDEARRYTRRVVVLVSRVIIGGLAIYGAWSLGVRYADGLGDEKETLQIVAADQGVEEKAKPTPESAPRTEIIAKQVSPPSTAPRTTPRATPPPVESPTPKVEAHRLSLLVPVRGVSRDDLRDSFHEPRGAQGARRHEAIDIHAPRNREVIAAEAGTILSISESPRGGKSVRQLSSTGQYVYFYAHLEGYARGLEAGDTIRRGQTLGYVGTSGNAAENAPHLHFAIADVTADPRQRRGPPVNPYPILKREN